MAMPGAKLLVLSVLLVTATSMAADETGNGSIHERCRLLKVGMDYRNAMAIMQREPDSTLNGHTAADPFGGQPAGSYAIDFWQELAADGRRLVSQMRYSGGEVESFECGRPADGDSQDGNSSSDNGN
ncbi:hypothetical protein OK348_11495 [Flavobacterium sp. MXW15]|uniref:Uncharacterized protein n=1 Tax=Xanthomonas chitinilytica TaxID=2989819 RepID=A0ABT3JYD1_9XANT|nr:hypothetical protein [Xanthomonas sp. H13-6]MCW4455413.1 hypothetical protein [Flavobacterium sp. MXW15]MCW4473505.1 hypothetical protein [Xanthomonas sp. H13-6]